MRVARVEANHFKAVVADLPAPRSVLDAHLQASLLLLAGVGLSFYTFRKRGTLPTVAAPRWPRIGFRISSTKLPAAAASARRP